jgi:serine protease
MLQIQKKVVSVVVAAAMCTAMVPACAFGSPGAESDDAARAAAAAQVESDAAQNAEGVTGKSDVQVVYSEGMETDGVLVFLDSDAVDAEDSTLQTLAEDSCEFVSETAQDVLDAAAEGDAAIETLADLAQAVIEDEGLTVSDATALDESTCVLEVSVDQNATEEEVDATVDALSNTPGATIVQPNFVYELLDEESSDATLDLLDSSSTNGVTDPYATDANSWWIDAAGFSDAWQIAQTNNAVTVAVLDSGCMISHPDIQANVLSDYAWDAVKQARLNEAVGLGGDAISTGHGTHVSGIIAAVANNGIGIAGGSYNANVLPIKVLEDNGTSSSSKSLVVAYQYVMQYASALNIRVINMSLGSTANKDGSYPNMMNYRESDWPDLTLKQSIDKAKDTYGIVTVCAGGNSGEKNGASTASSPTIWPGDYDNCVCVTSLTEAGTLASTSDDNIDKDITAPGTDILSLKAERYGTTNMSSAYKLLSGTSMAAPMVSAAFALLFAAVPNATVDDACAAIYNTATKYKNQNSKSGSHGKLNTDAALEYLIDAYATTDNNGEGDTSGGTNGSDNTGNGGTDDSNNGGTNPDNSGTVNETPSTTPVETPSTTPVETPDTTPVETPDTTGGQVTTEPFPDVEAGVWYETYANKMKALGLMTGIGSTGEFSPNTTLTRAQFALILWRAYEPNNATNTPTKDTTGLKDLKAGNQWYSAACNWAYKKGLMGQNVTEFNPNGAISMQDMCVILARLNNATTNTVNSTLKKFADGSSVADYAKTSVAWAVEQSIISGYEGAAGAKNSLVPAESLTRARAATIISRAIDSNYIKVN